MITKYMYKKIQDKFIGNVDYSVTKFYIGLSTTSPNVDGTNDTPPTTGSYARVLVDNDKVSWNNCDDSGVVSNKIKVYFPEATAPQGTVTHYTVYDALTGGNMLAFGELDIHRTIDNGMQMWMDIGNIKFTFQNI